MVLPGLQRKGPLKLHPAGCSIPGTLRPSPVTAPLSLVNDLQSPYEMQKFRQRLNPPARATDLRHSARMIPFLAPAVLRLIPKPAVLDSQAQSPDARRRSRWL